MRLSERNFTTTSKQITGKTCFFQHSFKIEQLKYGITDIYDYCNIFVKIQNNIENIIRNTLASYGYPLTDISNEQTKNFSPIQYQILRQAYLEIFKKLELNDIVLARVLNKHFNTRYTEKLMHITATGKDTILLESSFGTTIAYTADILEFDNPTEFIKQNYGIFVNFDGFRQKNCVELGRTYSPEYSKNEDKMFATHDSNSNYCHVGCYGGIDINQTLATICEVNRDDDGIKWPISIAPYQFYIVPDSRKIAIAENLYLYLTSHKQKAILDDRTNVTFQNKLKDAKALGVHYIVIIDNTYQENSMYEVENRFTGERFKALFLF